MTSDRKEGENFETAVTAADSNEQQKRISARDVENAEGTKFRSEESIPVTRVDWDGPNDPDNPMNWPRFKRNWQVIIVALIQLLSYASSDAISPIAEIPGHIMLTKVQKPGVDDVRTRGRRTGFRLRRYQRYGYHSYHFHLYPRIRSRPNGLRSAVRVVRTPPHLRPY